MIMGRTLNPLFFLLLTASVAPQRPLQVDLSSSNLTIMILKSRTKGSDPKFSIQGRRREDQVHLRRLRESLTRTKCPLWPRSCPTAPKRLGSPQHLRWNGAGSAFATKLHDCQVPKQSTFSSHKWECIIWSNQRQSKTSIQRPNRTQQQYWRTLQQS